MSSLFVITVKNKFEVLFFFVPLRCDKKMSTKWDVKS
jgi:hypothetical protein